MQLQGRSEFASKTSSKSEKQKNPFKENAG